MPLSWLAAQAKKAAWDRNSYSFLEPTLEKPARLGVQNRLSPAVLQK